MSAIEVHELAKTFHVGIRSRRVEAVRAVSFEVAQNEVFGFVGPNGAGKSTTIHMLLGLVRPSRGSGTLLGQPLGSTAARRRLGYLPELPNFYGYLKASELLEMAGRLAGVAPADLRQRVPELLRQLGLGGQEESFLRTFSKGMLQRVGLAQALISDPDLVILDEPMSGLDPVGRHIVRSAILDLKARGKTVFFSSHVLPDIEALCDRVALIAQGTTLRVAPVQDLIAAGDTGLFELQVRHAGEVPEGLPGVKEARRIGETLRLVVEGEEAAARAVDWGRGAGQLVSLIPVRETLEEVVVREIAALEGGGAP